MLYKFKTKAAGDLIMLEADGRRLLEIIGKDPGGPGIILPGQMAAAVEAIRAAVVAEEADQQRQRDEAAAKGEPPPQFESVSLRMRSTPFIEMLQRCQQADVEVVWGV